MVSITNHMFPIARGEDGQRIAASFEASKRPPVPGSMAHRLLEAKKAKKMAKVTKEFYERRPPEDAYY